MKLGKRPEMISVRVLTKRQKKNQHQKCKSTTNFKLKRKIKDKKWNGATLREEESKMNEIERQQMKRRTKERREWRTERPFFIWRKFWMVFIFLGRSS